ncbi:MAG: hypothetical protein AAFN74_15525 [Myxococcota bacterium]
MKRLAFVMSLAAAPMVACGGSNNGPAAQAGPAVEYPDWVMQGGGTYGGEKSVLYAVGAKSGIKNPGLLRNAADNMARAEMQKTIETYTASLMKDYSSSTATGDLTNSSEEQNVEQAVKTFAAGTLNGVQIVNRWIHPVDGTMYSLARWDLDGLMDKLDKAKELSQRVKERVRRSAERAMADLEREEAKRSGDQ